MNYREMLDIKVDVPVGTHGRVTIEQETITEEQAKVYAMRAAMGGHGRYTPAGTYTGLKMDGVLWMSDAPDEVRDQLPFIQVASGHVLIVGLGIGLSVEACLRKDDVDHITIVERELDVVEYVGAHYQEKAKAAGKRLDLHVADAWHWDPKPWGPFDVAWCDIWPTLCTDDLEEHTKMRRKLRPHMASKRADDVLCWAHEFLKARRRRGY